MHLFSLAIKAANSPNPNNKQTINNNDEPQNDQTKEISKNLPPAKDSGGGIFDKSFSNNKSSVKKMSDKIDSKADVELQDQIKDILNEETISCELKSDKIMDLIFQFRKKKVLETDREKIPNAQARLLMQGGSALSSTLSTQSDDNSLPHRPVDNQPLTTNKMTEIENHDTNAKKDKEEDKNNQQEKKKKK